MPSLRHGNADTLLGAFESRVYGAGPILSYRSVIPPMGSHSSVGKYYQEFDAKSTFEGHTLDLAFTAKF